VPPIYFDHNATTPLDPAVRERMLPFLDELYGNPSSVHQVGRRVRAALDEARERLARTLACRPSEIVFTSGGTESNNLAILGAARRLRFQGRGQHLITSPTEHLAVLACFEHLARHEGFQLTLLPVDREGLVDPAALRQAVRPDTILVSVMAANNETGTLQPVAELAALCREQGVCFHTDAVQYFGKEPFTGADQFQADLVSLCAHKFHGPKGAGALYVRSPLQLTPILLGGAHEAERRAGTENVAAIIGLVEAAERFLQPPVFPREPLHRLTQEIDAFLSSNLEGVVVRGSRTRRLANTIAFTVAGADSIALLAALDLEGVCASSGSACASGSLNPSHVLLATGVERALANSFVRFSLGRASTGAEVARVLSVLPGLIRRVRQP
jgi:cysteine desulfurase